MSGLTILKSSSVCSSNQQFYWGKQRRGVKVWCQETVKNSTPSYQKLDEALKVVKGAPPSMKQDASSEVMSAMKQMKEEGQLSKWGTGVNDIAPRRNIMVGELRQMGIKSPDKLATPSVRNDAAFLFSVVGVTSALAVVIGQLPGDWGFFGSYLTGSLVLVVLAIGSTAPGLLQFFIDKFSRIFPDYNERVLKHEAAHFLVGYLMGVPVYSYSVMLGKEHVDFVEAKLQQGLFQTNLNDDQINELSVISMAGVAAEGMSFEEVMGQTADLLDLQRILNRSSQKLNNNEQQNLTRWAAFNAALLLRKYKVEHEALIQAMSLGKSVVDCVAAIEKASSSD